MNADNIVYAFQSGGAKKVFALTYERTGSNLPKDRVWKYWKPFDQKRISEDSKEALIANGFWVPAELPEPEPIEPIVIMPRIAKRR